MANADNRSSHALYTRSLEDLNVIDNFLFTELSTNEDVNEEFFRIPAVHLSAAGIPFREGDRVEGRAEGNSNAIAVMFLHSVNEPDLWL